MKPLPDIGTVADRSGKHIRPRAADSGGRFASPADRFAGISALALAALYAADRPLTALQCASHAGINANR
jgi:hypothetical protein